MKKSDLKKIPITKKLFHSQLVTSLLRAPKIVGDETESKLQVPAKGLSDTLLTYDELQRTNAQLVKMEEHRAEAIWLIRERNRSGV